VCALSVFALLPLAPCVGGFWIRLRCVSERRAVEPDGWRARRCGGAVINQSSGVEAAIATPALTQSAQSKNMLIGCFASSPTLYTHFRACADTRTLMPEVECVQRMSSVPL
jgi:hypothetical protein